MKIGVKNEDIVGWRFRRGLFGTVVLQKKIRCPAMSPGLWDHKWRDASVKDFEIIE